jgi:hypothetical protein|tara:strand:- start:393 stop:896 length:504 start_codon:yes stop_codon:yes gene_type:complete
MKYIFYKIIFFNGKNKRIYKKESSIKLYCKLNGKMIDIKKYKELCKKPKTKKVKSTKTKKTSKKVKSTKTKKTSKKVKSKKFKKTKIYNGGDKLKSYEELRRIDLQSIDNIMTNDLKSLYNQVRWMRSNLMATGNEMNSNRLITLQDKVYKQLLARGYNYDGEEWHI